MRVRGRKTGEWRTTPVNLLVHEGDRYLVAPRGHTQWVGNLRAAGCGELRVGRRVEPFEATEITDDDKPEILRAYLRRWKVEVGVFFAGVDAWLAMHEREPATFYLTDFLCRHFDRLVIRGLKLDTHPELLPMYERMYGPRKYAPKADRARVTNIVQRALGRQVAIRTASTAHPSASRTRPTQLNLL